jgi:hypothetical protein
MQSAILDRLEREIIPGMTIPKPKATSDFTVKGWGKRRGEWALIYEIPNHKSPTKPYQKGVTTSEWEQAFAQINASGELSRSWFDAHMPACAKEGGCNFTTIGGIFELLGMAEYRRGCYIRPRRVGCP